MLGRMLCLCCPLLAWAQFPAVCNAQDSLSTKTCCPDNCGSRGTCVSIHEEVDRSWGLANATIVKILHGLPGWPQDVRYQWPLKIFKRVCSAVRDGEAMTAAIVTSDPFPTKLSSVCRGAPISSWFDRTLCISASRSSSTTSGLWKQLRMGRRRNGQ